MIIHVFVISWRGQHDNATRISNALEGHVDRLSVVFSDPDPARAPTPPQATHELLRTRNDLYWSDKFKTCLDHCTADVMLVIHADCTSDDWPQMVQRCRMAFSTMPKLGYWAPQVDGAGIPLEWTRVAKVADSLNLVAYIDGIVFAIAKPVMARMALYDYRANLYGWGIDWAISAFVYTSGRLALVDGSVLVRHPPGGGYDRTQAMVQMNAFIRQMRPEELVYFTLARSHVRLTRSLQVSPRVMT